MDKFKNEGNKTDSLSVKQLDSVAAGLKGLECKFLNRNTSSFNPEEIYTLPTFAQRTAFRKQLSRIEADKISENLAVEHFNTIDVIDKDNCTF